MIKLYKINYFVATAKDGTKKIVHTISLIKAG